ncbi:MAG: hypothetical protein H2041_06665 [Phenylobacterium sp.]|jgi:hypothetical protein|uniref:hypothetical protein n=1 Tax=unclassified Phenylobacterium TaxID=2640670 RepID=UPI00086D0661|nr:MULTISPECIES: hypothetical protein [unclassified Phenylobacterium]MBA4793332.1 hypothetical protein [Phenylobacterium sp.]MCR5873077.1 hypothetical protein [Phenylobacterium sp. J426]ODT85542.1 MAG: hypothetical protein ABS78_20050 [Phenylobacterium sp. SCN 70-31]OHB38495.1 MAG: hypothetical protein A2882_06195 [Phenylobacterium sp. RIFCSPHIGHO2_01_FULL_70_10]
MLPDLTRYDRWKLITAKNVRLKRLWPWGLSIQRILAPKERGPAPVRQLVVASDFGGEHKSATHILYVYLVVATGLEDWTTRMAALRHETLGDRTMAYKKLGDGVRQAALPAFLSAAADLDGHLVAIAVDKRQKWLSTQPGMADELRRVFQLQCSWNPRALEALMRKAHFLALLLSVWAPAGAHVTWLTDQDEFVANDKRHDDALLAAGRLSSMYLDQPMGIFALNTTAQDSARRHFEDLCSVADLMAGLLSDARAGLPSEANWAVEERRVVGPDLPLKAQVLLDWFADRGMRLRKTLISIDYLGAQSMVRELWTESDLIPEPPKEGRALSV